MFAATMNLSNRLLDIHPIYPCAGITGSSGNHAMRCGLETSRQSPRGLRDLPFVMLTCAAFFPLRKVHEHARRCSRATRFRLDFSVKLFLDSRCCKNRAEADAGMRILFAQSP